MAALRYSPLVSGIFPSRQPSMSEIRCKRYLMVFVCKNSICAVRVTLPSQSRRYTHAVFSSS